MIKHLDVVALGSCYIDINSANSPFSSSGIPVDTELVSGGYDTVPGGSAVNFCRLLAQLGARPAFIGMAGQDQHGDTLGRLLERANIQASLIRRPDLQTNISFNLTNPQGQHIMLVAGTANAALDPAMVLPRLEQILPQARMLYLGGCLKLTAFEQSFALIPDLAAKHGVQLVIDHGRVSTGMAVPMLEAVKQLVLRTDYYFPSRDEFCQLWQFPDIESGLHRLHDQASQLITIVKDGPNGAFYWANGAVQHIPGIKIETGVNVTGAGDSFNAGVMAAVTRGLNLSDAIGYGCRVAVAKVRSQSLPLL